jgi:RNA polymerase sigma-70 factor (ECF subfamily)
MDDRIDVESSKLFKTLYDEYFNLIFIICMKYTNQNRDDAYDAVQNTFMKAYLHMDDVRDKLAYKSWLVAIAVNEGKNYLKSKIRGRGLIEKFHLFSDLMANNDYDKSNCEENNNKMIEKIRDYIKNIENPDTQLIVEMFYIKEKKTKEISKELNINISTITTKLNRFRSRLSKDLMITLMNKQIIKK